MYWIDQLRAEYEAIQEPLEELRGTLEAWLCQTIQGLNIKDVRIASRVKTPDSFIAKVIKKQAKGDAYSDPIVDSSDKIGIRADLVFLGDVYRLRDEIAGATSVFEEPVHIDDKASFLGTDRIGYQGIHLDVIPKDRPLGLSKDAARCEIQIRTNAQAAWAMAAHDLTYKAPLNPPSSLQRRINRLTVLLELFDESVSTAKDEMSDSDQNPLAIIIDSLEYLRMRYITGQYDRELTRIVVSAICGSLDTSEARQLEIELEAFCNANTQKLEQFFGGSCHEYLLAQPESLLVFYMLENCRFRLRDKWVTSEMAYEALEGLAVFWGVRLPPPD